MSSQIEWDFHRAEELDLSSLPATDPTQSLGLGVTVIFTTIEGTLVALKAAADLARPLVARIHLLLLQAVPHQLPLERPPVSVEFSVEQLRALATKAGVETDALAILCRDQRQALIEILMPRSLVVMGGRRRRWPTKERRLARLLKRHGHEVIFAVLNMSTPWRPYRPPWPFRISRPS